MGDPEALQEGSAVIGDGGGVDEHPDHQHHEVEGAEQHAPVLAEVAGDDAGVILAFGRGGQGVDEEALEHVHGRVADHRRQQEDPQPHQPHLHRQKDDPRADGHADAHDDPAPVGAVKTNCFFPFQRAHRGPGECRAVSVHG
ncbi:hypothetical protein D3C75_712710 [compost metagenome]